LGPVWPDLEGVSKLVIVPTDGLFRVPFAALGVDETTVIDRFQMTIANSASAWLVSRNQKASGSGSLVAALGDFEGEDGSLTPLPGSLLEAKAIAAHLSQPTILLEQDMSSDRLQSESHGKQLLHLATHGYLDEVEPLFSGLAFSDRRVTAAETIIVCQPQKWILESKSDAVRHLHSRWVE